MALHDGIVHYPQSALRWTKDIEWVRRGQVLLTRSAQVPCAIVFIHGWGGGARSTWEQFPEMISQRSSDLFADAYFLEYRSTGYAVAWCAAMLREFLTDLVSAPAPTMINASLPEGVARPDEFKYEQVVLVGHSMGAVISRRALLDMDVDRDVLSRLRLLFFAPAHCGADVARLVGSGFGLEVLPGAKLVSAAVQFFLRSLPDLEPGSETLRRLATDTGKVHAANGGKAEHLRACVYHAQDDRVVIQTDFEGDPPFRPVRLRDHRSICKPDPEYQVPAAALREVLATLTKRTANASEGRM